MNKAELLFTVFIGVYLLMTLGGLVILLIYNSKVSPDLRLYQYWRKRSFLEIIPGIYEWKEGHLVKGIFLLLLFGMGILGLNFFKVEYPLRNLSLIIRWGVSGLFFIGTLVINCYDSLLADFEKYESKFYEYRMNLQKFQEGGGSVPQGGDPPPVPQGGFQRKVKGTPHFEPMSPLPDEKPGSKNKDN